MSSSPSEEPNLPRTRTRVAGDRSQDIERIRQFIVFNSPGTVVGTMIILLGYWLTRSPALFVLLGATLLNGALTFRAYRALGQQRLEFAVVHLAVGLWLVALALWFTLPRLYGISIVICVLPVMLAAAYVRRDKAVPIAIGGVVVAAIGSSLHPWRPLLGEVGLPDLMVELLIVGIAPVVVASCALAVWHAVSRLLELIEDTEAKNRALIASEQQLEQKVELRTADLRQSQHDLSLARDEALAANRAKSTFLANMSHELRTPLNAIIGYGEMLHEDLGEDGSEEVAVDLERIVSSGKHLLGLINDVLDLSKIEAGKVDLHAEEIQVAELLEGAGETVRPLMTTNGNTLHVSAPADLASMHSDLTRLRQILFNLLSNAAKFTSDGDIRLECRRETVEGLGWLVFTVRDNGIGMTAEQLERVFDAFSQAESSTTRDYGGTGLGLAITRHFCEMLGGSIGVESRLGEGTEFVVRLPAQMSVEPSGGEPVIPSSLKTSDSASATVLVIDDEETARDLLRRTLEREGYGVVCATSAEDGLRMARELEPDLITLDILMPHVDGWSVLTQLKSDPKLADIPVVVVTMTDDQELCHALGAAEYMSKPVDRSRLSSIVRRLAGHDDGALVMVVEDDKVTRELLTRTVARAGFRIVTADNGRVALQKLADEIPAVVLLDLVMPEMNGFDFLSEMRSHEAWAEVPVVVVTAKELTAQERDQLVSSAEKVLQKGSYDRDSLLAEIERQLERSRASGTVAEAPTSDS